MLSIKQYQKNLKHLGYYGGAVDGKVGSLTRSAIKTFQADHDLTVDGIYGAKTNAILIYIVKSLQEALKVGADGKIGTITILAIRNFQSKNGLVVDGIAGVKTRAVLYTGSEIDWSKTKYYQKEDFKCQCEGRYCDGYPAQIDIDLINVLEEECDKRGEKLKITSGLRCTKRNKEVGGVSGSRHTLGKAADVYGNTKSETLKADFKADDRVRYTSITGGRAVHTDVY